MRKLKTEDGKRQSKRKWQSRLAMTLTEVVFSMGIFGLVMTPLSASLIQTLQLNQTSYVKADALQDASAVLEDLISMPFQSLREMYITQQEQGTAYYGFEVNGFVNYIPAANLADALLVVPAEANAVRISLDQLPEETEIVLIGVNVQLSGHEGQITLASARANPDLSQMAVDSAFQECQQIVETVVTGYDTFVADTLNEPSLKLTNGSGGLGLATGGGLESTA